MVRPINSVTRARARAVAEGTMADTCVRLEWTQLRNSDNQETGEDWLPADPPEMFRCAYQPAQAARAGQAASRESAANVVTTTPVLRLPLAAADVFTTRDRVRITHRAGVELATPLEYGIQGDLLVGSTAVVVLLSGSHT